MMEVLDDIIRDGDKLRPAMLADGDKFRYMLERAERFLAHSGQILLFRDDADRASDPGNRCKLYLRHALLMALIHKKDSPETWSRGSELNAPELAGSCFSMSPIHMRY